VIEDREQVIGSMQAQPWDRFKPGEERVLRLGGDGAVSAYRASVTRGDQHCQALVNSTYVLVDNRWYLALHQQTLV
jgi:hypothetical protein